MKPDRTTQYVRAVMSALAFVAMMVAAHRLGGPWAVVLALSASVTMQVSINHAVDELRS